MSFIDKIPHWLRWAALLPASVITYVLGYAVVNVVGSLLNFLTPGLWGSKFTSYILAPIAAGYWCIAVLGMIAPSRQKLVALIATGGWMFVYGVLAFFALIAPGWATFLPVAFSIFGSTSAFMSQNDSHS